jgi:reactive intermediate/imine deaminase
MADDQEGQVPKQVLRPKNLMFQPRPSFPYSPGAAAGGWVFTAGQVAWNDTGEIVGIGDVRMQSRQVLSNVASILAEAGGTLADVLKCTVYLADIRTFQAMNDVFAEFFPQDPPARTTVQAALADPQMLVEIEAIAFLTGGGGEP